MKLIGKGAFTKAYLKDDNKTVFLKSVCPIKECMAYGWFPESYLFPTLESVGNNEYEMQYYPKVTSLKQNLSKHQWELYKTLRNLNMFGDFYTDKFTHWHEQFDTIPNKFSKEREALKEALDGCANYGYDIGFEISPRNVATKGKKLVLLDCFFSVSQLHKVRTGEIKVA